MILVRYWHIGLLDSVTLLLNWLLFITLLVSVHFLSMPGIIATLFTYLVLQAGYGKSSFRVEDVMKQVKK